MAVLEAGLDTMKFFPAGPAGGPSYLAAIGAPVPHVQFCPTGGITLATAPDYLRLPNVACVGGSWLTPVDAVAAKDWDRITDLAAESAQLKCEL
ncbi:Entner-Doudoroff aldolase [Pseudarthrobacter enclensis]|uniref:Entner-Doudoroff aldolase n=1 Tax=Pseudarthrobacter enclensis TaxID=993070 RepID=A0ABT9S0N6_9MICC|nr:Entner-Doudoroff aldolase [Pseudarthrobacter enclensis]